MCRGVGDMLKGMWGDNHIFFGKKKDKNPKGVRRGMAAERMVVLECGGRASLVATVEGQRIDLYFFSHDPSLAEPFSHVDTLKLSELPPGATISLFKQTPASPEDEPCLLVGTPGGALLEVPSLGSNRDLLTPIGGSRFCRFRYCCPWRESEPRACSQVRTPPKMPRAHC